MVPAHVKTLGELLALALALELRAAARFRLMAARMREEGRDDLVSLFEGLAREEDRHAEDLRRLPEAAEQSDEPAALDVDPDLAALSSAPNGESLRQLSIYDCLAEAVRNEINTFDFFSNVAAKAEDDALQDLAERLAKEELEHATVLRRVRREAFHQQRRAPGIWPKASAIETLDDLRAAALGGEQAVAARVGALKRQLPELEEISRSIADLLSQPAEHRSQAPRATPEGAVGLQPRDARGDRTSPDRDLLRAALDGAKEAFAFYDAIVTVASREDVMLTAQALSMLALKRIELLHDRLTTGEA